MRKRQPRRGSSAKPQPREPSVAGIFYPEQKRALEELLDRFLKQDGPRQPAIAALTPHGNIRASGPVAGAVFSGIETPAVAVVIGPDHSRMGKRCSVELRGNWDTPLGSLPVDEKLARRILEKSSELEKDPDTHTQEHSVEAVLPFLQRSGIKRFVPIALAVEDLELARKVGLGVAAAVQSWKEPVLLVASAHLTSYQPAEVARRNDPGTLDRILAMDEEKLMNWAAEQNVSLCGGAAAAAVLVAAKALGAAGGHLVKYEMHSPSAGQSESVSGYAGVIFR